MMTLLKKFIAWVVHFWKHEPEPAPEPPEPDPFDKLSYHQLKTRFERLRLQDARLKARIRELETALNDELVKVRGEVASFVTDYETRATRLSHEYAGAVRRTLLSDIKKVEQEVLAHLHDWAALIDQGDD